MKNNVKIQDDTQSLQSCVSVSVTDLRVGNLLKYKHLSEVSTISAVDIMHISDDNSNVEPIPLTEEWFLKFGFVVRYFNEDKNKPLMWKVEGNRHIDLYYEIQVSAFAFKINNIQYSNPIKYVHQLQNLYYALTGSDLQIGNLTEH